MNVPNKTVYCYAIIIFLLTVLPNRIYAEKNWVFKTGFNTAQIRNVKSTPQLGASIGIERKFHITSLFSVAPEIFFSQQTCYTYNGISVDNRELYDKTLIHIRNMDLSIILDFLIVTGKVNLTLRVFPSYNFSKYEYTDYYKSGVGYNHVSSDNHGLSLNMAIAAQYKRFSFEIRYMNNREILDKNSQYYEYIQNDYMIHSLHFLFGFHF